MTMTNFFVAGFSTTQQQQLRRSVRRGTMLFSKCWSPLVFSVRVLAAMGAVMYAPPILAQTDTSSRQLTQVVITALRKKEQALNTPYSTAVVDTDYLNKFSPRTTPEALMNFNGVFVQKTNHGGGSAFIRGLTGNQTLLLVDGIRLNNATFRYGPNQYLNTIDAFTIQHIEVLKGSGAVQYGSDALGGAIQVITKTPLFTNGEPAWKVQLLGRGVTQAMEQTARGGVSYTTRKIAAQVGITHRRFGDLIGGDTSGRQAPSGYTEIAIDAKAKLQLRQNILLTIAHQLVQQRKVPVYHKVVLEDFSTNEINPQCRILSYAKLNFQTNHTLLHQIEITASFQQNKEGRNSRKNTSLLLRKEKDQVSTKGLTVDIASIINKHWSVNSGVEWYHDRINSSRVDINTQTNEGQYKRGLYPNNANYCNYAAYSLHHFNKGKWRFDAGVRFNAFDIRMADTVLGNVRIRPTALVFNAAALYNIGKGHRVYITINSGFRAPNIDDMGTLGIVDFRYEIPTQELLPEKSLNYEAGYKFGNQRLSLEASVYYMQLQQLITRVKLNGQIINGYAVYRKENTEQAFIRGAEGSLNMLISSYWRAGGSINYTYGQNTTKQEPLRRIPPVNGRLFLQLEKKQWFATAESWFASRQNRLAQGDKEDNRINPGGTPAWRVVNFYAGYGWRKLKMNITFQNIFNADYRTHGSGINGMGRSILVALQLGS
jgi:hemoglobin/transferrin/lactoferrin receptor protein